MSEKTKVQKEKKVIAGAPFVFRELTADDVFPMFKLIGKLGKDTVKEIFASVNVEGLKAKADKKEDDKKDPLEVAGYEFVMSAVSVLLAHLPDCKQEIYDFLAGVSNLDAKQIRHLPMATFADMLISLFTKPDFMDFFKVVLRLVK